MVGPLAKTLLFALCSQLLPAAVFVPLQTEKFYDLCGSLGFLFTTAFSLYNTPTSINFAKTKDGKGGAIWNSVANTIFGRQTIISPTQSLQQIFLGRHARQLMASACVGIWAVRLGSYLFARIHKTGRDPRFDTIRSNPPKFLFAWSMQAVWIGLTALPVYMINSLPTYSQPSLNVLDAVALFVWTSGLALEIVADRTKAAWRAEREQGQHKEPFLARGVWSWSRHPNYFGEITLWTGLALLACFTLRLSNSSSDNLVGKIVEPTSSYNILLPFLSPVFEYLLIRFLSGVPMLERDMDKKLKGNAKYKAYKAKVPCFVPFIGSKQ